jgi:hypothetical protein
MIQCTTIYTGEFDNKGTYIPGVPDRPPLHVILPLQDTTHECRRNPSVYVVELGVELYISPRTLVLKVNSEPDARRKRKYNRFGVP